MSHQGKRAASRRPIALLLSVTLAISSWRLASAVLVQPHNYLLDDSPLTNQHDQSGSLSPFFNDAHSGAEQQDKDIVSIISDSLSRLRLARMLDQQSEHEQAQGLSAEMAELISEQQAKAEAAAAGTSGEQPSLSSSVASMLLNAAQSAAAGAQEEQAADSQESPSEPSAQMSQRGQIMELNTSQAQGAQAAAQPSKADLKQPIQWYNPKETIPVLKISSMATPSKYKKVYFRSEKKLVDGAFHSPSASEQADKRPALKPFGHSASAANVQRRSSRGSGASAPPSVLQDGVIDFLKKFRDVYVQTRPAGPQAAASSPANPLNFASSLISAAASSPLATFLAPASSSSPSNARPNLMSALSTASQMVNGAQTLAQASPAASSPASGSPSGAAGASGTAAAAAGSGSKPLTAQSYVSFWSKTFPTWVRKMLKQMRRRSLYNSSKRQQHAQHSHQHHAIGQKSASVPTNIASDSNSGSQANSQPASSSS